MKHPAPYAALVVLGLISCLAISTASAAGETTANGRPSPPPAASSPGAGWATDYREATLEAQSQRRMLLLWFVNPSWATADADFEQVVFQDSNIADRISQNFVAAKIDVDQRLDGAGDQLRLIDHPAFEEMQATPGLAVIDYRDPESPHFGRVVSVYPFRDRYISGEHLAAMLDLPSGSLTQRTLIFAVRTHPEYPASASTRLNPVLVHETAKHAAHQASITLQGHHNWDSRFQSINARLPAGFVSREVCAESWPGQSLVEAAIECVDSWRQSPGHWESVSSKHEMFAYDMQRGSNGVWYAVGIFAGPYHQ